jgi:mycothiol synthase
MLLETIDQINPPDAPSIDGLAFRLFRDDADYAAMAALRNASGAADGVEEYVSVEWARVYLAPTADFDPYRDLLFAEIGGQPVAYARAWARHSADDKHVYTHVGAVAPAWRRNGLGRVLLRWIQDRSRARAASQPDAGSRVFRSWAADTAVGTIALLSANGYQATRYGFEMSRSLAEPIPDLPLPAGLEVRPIAPAQYRQVYAALDEAFCDIPGHARWTEDDYQRWLKDPAFQPALWQVAWAGDEVVGMVLNFIDHEGNAELKCLRGWTDPIGVRRPWRKQGLASALIARSLRLLHAQGMTEARLGVDAQSPNGALRLYESLGFCADKQFTTFEKPMD